MQTECKQRLMQWGYPQPDHNICMLRCAAEAAPGAAAEASTVSLAAGFSSSTLPPAAGERSWADGYVTLATFKQLLDRLLQQKAGIEDLLPASSIDIMKLNVAGLKQSLLPWPQKRLAELHQALPVLAAGGFGGLQQQHHVFVAATKGFQATG